MFPSYISNITFTTVDSVSGLYELFIFDFREALNEERMQRKAKVAERRERRLQEKNLFDNDVVERRKREDSSEVSSDGEDFDYSYYYYGEGDDYEVYVGGKLITIILSCYDVRPNPYFTLTQIHPYSYLTLIQKFTLTLI